MVTLGKEAGGKGAVFAYRHPSQYILITPNTIYPVSSCLRNFHKGGERRWGGGFVFICISVHRFILIGRRREVGSRDAVLYFSYFQLPRSSPSPCLPVPTLFDLTFHSEQSRLSFPRIFQGLLAKVISVSLVSPNLPLPSQATLNASPITWPNFTLSLSNSRRRFLLEYSLVRRVPCWFCSRYCCVARRLCWNTLGNPSCCCNLWTTHRCHLLQGSVV